MVMMSPIVLTMTTMMIFLTFSGQFQTGRKLMMTTTQNHLTLLLLKHDLVLLGEVEAWTDAYSMKLMMTTTQNHLTLLKHYLVLLGEVEAWTDAYLMAS
jgi:hypothetical protein